jgi:hypothetical protein
MFDRAKNPAFSLRKERMKSKPRWMKSVIVTSKSAQFTLKRAPLVPQRAAQSAKS